MKKLILGCALAGLLVAQGEVIVEGENWTSESRSSSSFTGRQITLAGGGPYVVSGSDAATRIIVGQSATIVVSNLTIAARGTIRGVFELGEGINVDLVLVGSSTIGADGSYSNLNGAGLYVHKTSSLTIRSAAGEEGTLHVSGGNWGAAIGGYCNASGRITIESGRVIAEANRQSAAIGAGDGNTDFTAGFADITISGGYVTAICRDEFGSAVGAGHNCHSGGTVRVTGGTLNAYRIYNRRTTADIGWWQGGTPVLITGGNVRAGSSAVYAVPSNGTARVWCVTIPLSGVADGAAVSVAELTGSCDYGFYDVRSIDGKIYLWLPDGEYALRTAVGGTKRYFTATVSGAAVEAQAFEVPDETGVTVNGHDVAFAEYYGVDENWTYEGGILFLRGTGPYVLSGTNTAGDVHVDVKSDSHLVVSNLVLGGFADRRVAGIYVDYSNSPSIELKGVNAIEGGANRPAIEVQYNAALAITGDGRLAATAGSGADIIGRYTGYSSGTVTITGGRYSFEPKDAQVPSGYAAYVIDETVGGYRFIRQVGAYTPTGVTVNGTDAGLKSGTGWTLSGSTLRLTGAGPFELAGTNLNGKVRILQTADATVTLRNLCLTSKSIAAPYSIGSGVHATLKFVGHNELVSSVNGYPAVRVPIDGTLTILAGDGLADAEAWLVARGGSSAAGIGADCMNLAGTIVIDSGTVEARGGFGGAGIGGANMKGSSALTTARIRINGGHVIAAGGDCAAGIGTGLNTWYGRGADIDITGGIIEATGGSGAAGIGGGYDSVNTPSSRIEISGGTIEARGTPNGSTACDDIGAGWHRTDDFRNCVAISGGNVICGRERIAMSTSQPQYAVRVKLPSYTQHLEPVALEMMPDYGTNDLFAVDGNVALWLTNGIYAITLNGHAYRAEVNGTNTDAYLLQPSVTTGLSVDGEDVGSDGAGRGWNWRCETSNLTFTASGDYALAGASPTGLVNVVLEESVATRMRFDRVSLSAGEGRAAFSGSGSFAACGGTLVVTGGVDCAWQVTGGSLFIDGFSVAPSNGTKRVWRVTVSLTDIADVSEDKPVTIERLPAAYDVAELYPIDGQLCLWLPDGSYDFLVNGKQNYRATVNGEDAVAEPYTPEVPPVVTGFTIDGVDVGNYVGRGWTWDPATSNLTFIETSGYVLASSNAVDQISISVSNVEVFAGLTFANVVAISGAVTGRGGLVLIGGTAALKGAVETPVMILGGSIDANGFAIAPSNASERVWRVDVTGLAAGATAFDGLPDGYVTNGIVSVQGKVSLWLPNGDYRFTANGVHYRTTVADADAVAEIYEPDYAVDAIRGSIVKSYETVSDAILAGENHLRLRRDITNEILQIDCRADFTLEGAGHAFRPNLAAGGDSVFTVRSNATVVLSDVAFDGIGSSTAVSNSEITAFVQIHSFGYLAMTNCTVRGFRFSDTVIAAGGSETMLTPDGYPACALKDTVFTDNVTALDFIVREGLTLAGDYTNRIVRLTDDAMIAVRGETAYGNIYLDILDARKRIGDVIVTNAFGANVEAYDVHITAAGYAAFGKGDITLGHVTDHPFAVTYGEDYGTYATFAEALAAAQTAESNRVDLLYYVNLPLADTNATVAADATVPAGVTAALGTVRRETPDGTNTVWTIDPVEPAMLAGILRVEGAIELGNVALAKPIALATGGVIRVRGDCPLATQVYRVAFDDAEAMTNQLVVTSEIRTPAELKAAFRVVNPGYTFFADEGGLWLVRVQPCVARGGHEMFYASLAEAFVAAENGETLSLVAITNATTGVFSNRVELGIGAVVPANRTLTLGSICRKANGTDVDWDESASVVLVATADAPLTIGAGAVLKLTNMSVSGTLALAGEGLLDLTNYTGETIGIAPQRYGTIAIGASAAKLRLADGIAGVLRFAEDGSCRYGSGTVTFDFTQTGNGMGRITINDDGNESYVDVTGQTGDQTYTYISADKSVTNRFDYGIIQYSTAACRFNALPNEATYSPRYLNKSGAWEKFTSQNVPNNNISVDDNGDIHLKCNGKAFTLSGLGYSKEEKKKKVDSVTSVFSHILSLSGAIVGVAGVSAFLDTLLGTSEITSLGAALESFFGLGFDALGIVANALAFVDFIYNIFFRAFATLYYNGTYYQMSDVPAAIQSNIKDNEKGNYRNTVYTLRDIDLSETLICQSYDTKHGYLVWDGNCNDLKKSANGFLYNYDFYKAESGLSTFEEIVSVFDFTTLPGIGKRIVSALEIAISQSCGPFEFAHEKESSEPALIVTDGAEAQLKNFRFISKSMGAKMKGPRILVENTGVLSLKDVEMSAPNATASEKGIINVQAGGIVELSGETKITGNRVSSAAVAVDAGGELWVSEKATVSGNKRADGTVANVALSGASIHIGQAAHSACGYYFPEKESKYVALEGTVSYSGRAAGEAFGIDDFNQGTNAWKNVVPDGGAKNLKLQIDGEKHVSYVTVSEWKDPDDYPGTEAEKVYQAMIANGFPPVVAELITTKAAYNSLKGWAEAKALAMASVSQAELPIASAAFGADGLLTNGVSLAVGSFDVTNAVFTLRVEVTAGKLSVADELLATCAIGAEGTETLTNGFDRAKVRMGEKRYVVPSGKAPYIEVPLVPNLALPPDMFFVRPTLH